MTYKYDDSVYYILYRINFLIVLLLFFMNIGKHSIQLSIFEVLLYNVVFLGIFLIPVIILKIFHILSKKFKWKNLINNITAIFIEICSILFYALIALVLYVE